MFYQIWTKKVHYNEHQYISHLHRIQKDMAEYINPDQDEFKGSTRKEADSSLGGTVAPYNKIPSPWEYATHKINETQKTTKIKK